ncbi:MAG: cation-translocating P-type ATPase [bacterium]
MTHYSGLSSAEASERIIKYGFNELPSQQNRTFLISLFDVIKEPMFLLLIGSAILYLFLGEIKDALMLLFFVLVVIGITLYQERKTEKALNELKKLTSPRVLVIRNGEKIKISSREIVVDDIILLAEGDRVSADCAILETTNFNVNESILTGESLPVTKTIWDGKSDVVQPGGENLPYLYSGTLVTAGRATAQVLSIALDTQIGKIGKSLQEIEETDTLLKKEINRIITIFSVIGLGLCIIIVLVYGLTRGDWLHGMLSGLTLSMAMLPEEFPVVLTVFMTLGAWRLSKKKVLARKNQAIETLGAATVLCVDKTGTLTLNQMQLSMLVDAKAELLEHGKAASLPVSFHTLLQYSTLASLPETADPLEIEINQEAEKFLTKDDLRNHYSLIKEYPLTKDHVMMTHLWKDSQSDKIIVAAKGSPEAIFKQCAMPDIKILEKIIDKLSGEGLRILGVAQAELSSERQIPDSAKILQLKFLGLICFQDPIRPSVAKAVSECYQAGIQVKMITGDYPGTAQCIARQAGIKNVENYLTGADLNNLSKKELQERIKDTNIFARVIPEQKLLIVNALIANKEIVAMTGDGVNDSPALKAAHIGIAMGQRGTDVARETSDLVLLDDNFSSIVEAIKLGRRIFDNLQKAVAYIFSVHLPIAGAAIFPVIFQLPIILLPAHIAFLELIIDPACSTVFEAERADKDIMNRPPRNLSVHLFNKKNFIISLFQGLSVLAAVLITYLLALHYDFSEAKTRTVTFVTMIFSNVILIVINQSRTIGFINILKRKNKSMYWTIGLTLLFLTFILSFPFLRKLFYFDKISFQDVGLCFLITVLSLSWFEIGKWWRRK